MARPGTLDYSRFSELDLSDSDEEGGLDANESQAPRRGPGGLDLNDPLVAKLFGEDGRGGDPEALASLSRAELVRGIALSVQTGDILGEANFGRMLGRHLLAVEQAADEAHEEVLMADAEAALREAKARFEALGAPQQQLEDEFHTCCVDLATALRRGGKAAEALPLLSAAAEFGERTADTARRSAAAAARPAAQREAISNEGNARLLHAQAELGLGDSHRALEHLAAARRHYERCERATELLAPLEGGSAPAAELLAALREALAEVAEAEQLAATAPYVAALSAEERRQFERHHAQRAAEEAERRGIRSGDDSEDEDDFAYILKDVGPKARGPAAETSERFTKEMEAMGPKKLLSMLSKSGQGANPEMARVVHQARAMARALRVKGREEDARALERDLAMDGPDTDKKKGENGKGGEKKSAKAQAWYDSIVADAEVSSDEEGEDDRAEPRTWEEARRRMDKERAAEGGEPSSVPRARSPERASSPPPRNGGDGAVGSVADIDGDGDDGSSDDDIMASAGAGGAGAVAGSRGRARTAVVRAGRTVADEQDDIMELGGDDVF